MSLRRLVSLSSACLLSLTLTSCTSSHISPPIAGATLQGKVFGGQLPITAATIQLYSVGTATDGGPSLALLTTTVTTSDGTGLANANANLGNANNTLPAGYFNITGDYTCATASTLVFLTASGGNASLGTNTSIRNVAALGTCSNLKTNVAFITINEVTTVGAVAALYPYMTAWNAIGSTPAHAAALTTAFNTANEYVNFQTGHAPGTALPNGYDASSNDIDALANVIASCVNTAGGTYHDGSACGTLYFLAKGTATANPADTVAALLDIRNNPTNNVTTIFNQQPVQPPFQPVNAAAPADFTLPILPLPGTPAFSVAAGTYNVAKSVTITDSDPTAVLYYTTDGTTPTTASTVYTAAIAIAIGSPETLKALAVESGRLFSPVASATYTLIATPTVTLSAVNSPSGAVTPVTITATESGTLGTASGSVVTFGITSPATGTFSPATCTIASGSCSVSYLPSGVLATGTYTNGLTASFTASGGYTAASATATLTIAATSFTSTTFTLLDSFTGTSGAAPGANPLYENLIQGSDGGFYGTAVTSGANSWGTVFKISSTGTFSLLHSFSAATSDSAGPYAGLVQGSDGSFYGTTNTGGATGRGTVFKITSTGSFSLLHSFSTAPNDGQTPYAALVQGTDGTFYGTTLYGGVNNLGTVFRITSNGSFAVLHSFSAATYDGTHPYAPLVQGADGTFYGTTVSGGANAYGIVFRMDPYGYFQIVHSFSTATTDGENPFSGLVQGSDGSFYGTTQNGGATGCGTVFKITLGGNFSLLHSFSTATSDGYYPYSGLVQGSDGSFYGTTQSGGANNNGTVFKITSTGTFSLLHSFSPAITDGYAPLGGLIQGSDGSFYGLTNGGGANNDGILFKLTSTPTLAAPVTLTVPAGVTHGTTFTLGYAVSNAYSTTLKTCFATNTAGDTTGWTGPIAGSPTAQNLTLTAPATAGTYTYALTCGGMQSGFATLTVQ
jgi:uncharacterized repeat protein (TIGR03803 family)